MTPISVFFVVLFGLFGYYFAWTNVQVHSAAVCLFGLYISGLEESTAVFKDCHSWTAQ